MKLLSFAVAVAILTTGASAQACRAYRSPAQRLSDGYKNGAISAVALVTISRADYTQASNGDAHPWAASATVQRVVRGRYPERIVRFERGWGSSACDDGLPPPKKGESWVVYFWKRAEGDQLVWQTYPAEVVSAADPLLSLDGG